MRYFAAALPAFRLWIITAFSFGVLLNCVLFIKDQQFTGLFILLVVLCSAICSIPAFFFILLIFNLIERQKEKVAVKILRFRISLFLVVVVFAIPAGFVFYLFVSDWRLTAIPFGCLLLATSSSYWLCIEKIEGFFSNQFPNPVLQSQHEFSLIPNTINDQLLSTAASVQKKQTMQQNNILVKGIITAVLILLMLIPTFFITNLVYERKARQADVVAEVSNKWATAQTLSGYFLHIPYEVLDKDEKGKPIIVQKQLIVLPETQEIRSNLLPEIRPRSIYKVLLYKSKNAITGKFQWQLPKEIETATIKWNEAKICIAISDIKGIEERLLVKFNGKPLELSPGLPNVAFGKSGLSAPLEWTEAPLDPAMVFESNLQLKGSEQLHFIPLAGNSNFFIQSTWPSPSFDGNYLPGTRVVNDSGFQAKWSFNKANLPFGTYLREIGFEPEKFSFGITMVQPADQYAKTERSVKYAILFIGLTFSLFFVIELMQKKPVHPVQYVMIGLALSIFYTLLLSISEFLAFDLAYVIAATAVVLLITLYAKSHFRSTKTAFIFGSVLTCLYVFTFVLIRLEDTALLIGSIGLFIILSIAMYASRKVNWYGQPVASAE